MKEYSTGKRPLRGAFPKIVQEDKTPDQQVVDLAERRRTTQFFAVVGHGEVSDHFKAITPYGRSYTVKYAHLPHIVLEGDELMIILHDLQVLVKGRNLDIIADHISKNELLWVRQSPSGKDDEQSSVFISELQVRGSIHKLIGELKNEEE